MFTTVEIMNTLKANNYKETSFTLADGSVAVITPCAYADITTETDIEFYLVDCEGLPYLSDDRLEKVTENFNNILELRNKQDESKIQLRKFFASHEANGWDSDSWGMYSDWHKDIYGYRPHGHVCGIYVNPHTM